MKELSSLLPLSHAVDPVAVIALQPDVGTDLLGSVLVVVALSVAALVAGSLTLRRRTP